MPKRYLCTSILKNICSKQLTLTFLTHQSQKLTIVSVKICYLLYKLCKQKSVKANCYNFCFILPELLSYILSELLSIISSGLLSYILSELLSFISSKLLSYILSELLSFISPKLLSYILSKLLTVLPVV